MKKKSFIIFILFAFCLSSLLAFEAKITEVKGKVEIKQGGAWLTARKGASIKKGALISTGFKSEMTVKIDGSVIVVKALTRLKIEDIAKKNEAVSSEVFVNVGSIKANVKPASTKKVEFKVKTPVATASVRGTSGIISADGQLIGLTGVWDYSNNIGQHADVSVGNVVSVDSHGIIVSPQINALNRSSVDYKNSLADVEKYIMQILPLEKVGLSEKLEHTDADSYAEIGINIGWDD